MVNKINKKIIISAIVTFILIWISQFKIGVFFPPDNVYLNDSWAFFYPPIVIAILSIIFFKYNRKEVAIGIIIGGALYSLVLWFMMFAFVGEMVCQRYFFNLLTNCPGIK
jgi:hypothetical protein